MELSRCIELIHQGSGTLDEKYECASMGYWGNIPTFSPQPYVYSSAPAPLDPYIGEQLFNYQPRAKMRKCKSCNCGGAGAVSGGGALSPAGAAQSQAGTGFLAGSSVGFNFQFSGLLLLLLIVLMIAKRKG